MTDIVERLERSANLKDDSSREAPIQEILARGRQARRRAALGAASAALAFTAVVGIGSALLDRDPQGQRDIAPGNPDERPPPPEGMRWVQDGRVQVAVPESWSSNDARCGVPMSDTVVTRAAAEDADGCTPPERDASVSSLALTRPTEVQQRRFPATAESTIERSGVTIHVSSLLCTASMGSVCAKTVLISELNLILTLSGPQSQSELFDQIAFSLYVADA